MGSDGKTQPRRAGRLRFWMRRAAKVLLILAIALVLSIALFRFVNPPITPLMVGKWLSGYGLQHSWVPMAEISPNLPLAVIASEDGQFCEHWGVDWSAAKEALDEALERGRFRGASTITMQTAKNLYLWPGRDPLRKALEIPIAHLMTLLWPKQRVMEVYLNIVQWGPGIFGAEAASRHYFGKSAKALTRREAVLLAVSLPLPSVRNPAKLSAHVQRLARTVERRIPYISQRADCVRPAARKRNAASGQRFSYPL
jgi:monofunctional biosynthetic peptidoglycan transglycosylase